MFVRISYIILLCFLTVGWSWDGGWDAGQIPATAIFLNVDGFDGNLDSNDKTVQDLADKFDDFSGYSDADAQSATGWTDDGAIVRLTTVTDTVSIGTTATTAFPAAKLYVQNGITGHSYANKLGIVGEASAIAGEPSIGVGGVAASTGYFTGTGVAGRGMVGDTSDAGASIGVQGLSEATHAGGNNIAFLASAQNGATNYSFYGQNGEFYNSGSGNFVGGLKVSSTDSLGDRFVVTTAGNVGIGSTSPASKFDVVGSANISATLTAEQLTSTDDATVTDLLYVGGNVGIGTSVPVQKLDVVGNAVLRGDGAVNLSLVSTPQEIYGTGGDSIFNITDGGVTYRVHKFTTTGAGTFNPPYPSRNLEVLVIGGGGGGNPTSDAGGGGGAGGYVYSSSYSSSYGTPIGLYVAPASTQHATGYNSTFGILTALGGGAGGGYNSVGGNGGSGGGGGAGGNLALGGTGTQGSNGGRGYSNYTNKQSAGGGGGAGQVGADGTSASGGKGGNGIQSSITGTPTYYAGGGGGEGSGPGVADGDGGLGGGGSAASNTSGSDNTGGGGGGGFTGSKGGSGIVIVRYTTTGTTSSSPSIKLKSNTSSLWGIGSDGDDANKIKIGTPDFLSDTKLTITSSGYVGIGTTTPAHRLQVDGNVGIGTTNCYYLGAEAVDGTWRSCRSGNNLVFERRESGSYVTKSTMVP